MLYVNHKSTCEHRLPFYLAMEEYVARHLPSNDYFFMWQVEPTVIFGRNQLIDNEVNLEFCKKNNIQTYRRKSGGGCVYADKSNIMFSYITADGNVGFTYNRYIMMVVSVLRKLGLDATTNGRNDILVDGLKVSGNAFYRIPQRSIVHGTMLYDTNIINMVGSITPNCEKLRSKGIESVRQRITLLKDYIDISLEEFKAFVRSRLCDKEITLSYADEAAIAEIEKEYLSHEFIYGRNPKYNIVRSSRIDGVGNLEVRMKLKNGKIMKINLVGDYLLLGDIDNQLLNPLHGVELIREKVNEALPERLDNIIMNLEKQDFVSLLVQEQ